MNTPQTSPTIRRFGVAVVFAAFVTLASASGPCLEVDAPGSVQLPDGRQYEARTVQLCLEKPYTPTTSLVEVRIDGVSVGRYLAEIRPGASTSPGDAPFVVFDRVGGTGTYHLASVVVVHNGTAVSHRLWRAPGWQLAGIRPARPAPSSDETVPGVETVALAARWR